MYALPPPLGSSATAAAANTSITDHWDERDGRERTTRLNSIKVSHNSSDTRTVGKNIAKSLSFHPQIPCKQEAGGERPASTPRGLSLSRFRQSRTARLGSEGLASRNFVFDSFAKLGSGSTCGKLLLAQLGRGLQAFPAVLAGVRSLCAVPVALRDSL